MKGQGAYIELKAQESESLCDGFFVKGLHRMFLSLFVSIGVLKMRGRKRTCVIVNGRI